MTLTEIMHPTRREDWNAMLGYLKDSGYQWMGEELSYDKALTYFKDKRRKMLIVGSYNSITKHYELQLNFLSRINNNRRFLGENPLYAKDIRTAVPASYYKEIK